jgi:hypothetical protein
MSFRSGVMQSLAMNLVRGSKFGKSAVRASDSLFGKIHRKLPPRLWFSAVQSKGQPYSPKEGNKNFYKGYGCAPMGRHTRKGACRYFQHSPLGVFVA